MKKIITSAVLISLLTINPVFATENVNNYLSTDEVAVFSNDKGNLFGLKAKNNNDIIVDARYKKLIKLGNSSWIINKKNKYGLMDCSGNIIVEPKYRHVDRMLGKYAKLGNENNYGVYNEKGENIIPNEYMSIDMLFGEMFLIKKDYKYGIADKNGRIILNTIFDDIYMPKPNIMRIEYNGQ